MFPIILSEKDKLGRMFIKLYPSQASCIDNYFEGLQKLQPFLRSKKIESKLTGFYLSICGNGGIRFSYFTNNPEQAISFLYDQFSSLGFVKLSERKPCDELFDYYLGENKAGLEFRRFLQLITNIGLDLLQRNILFSNRLVAKYRLEIAPSGSSCKSYFESSFKKLSYYNSLNSELKEELLEGLDHWHTSWEDWAHMFVVMLLPGDWLYCCQPIFNPRRPLSRTTREFLSRGLLPDDWQP